MITPISSIAKAYHLKRAVIMSLNSIKGIGTSKHAARVQHNFDVRSTAISNGLSLDEVSKLSWAQSPLIHGISTYDQYVYICLQYAGWLSENHPDVSKLAYAFKRGYAREYVQRMIDLDYAPSSIARAACALAKLYRCHSNNIHDNIPRRCYVDFIRSRNYSEEQYTKDLIKYGIIVEICRYTGVRELELENLYPECFKIDAKGQLKLHLDGKKQNTKGGKTRDVVIIQKNQSRMREILTMLKPGELICPVAPSHLDIHGIRSMYTTDYYNSIAREIAVIPKIERIPLKHPKIDNSRPHQIRNTAPGVYRRKSDGKKFDRAALLIVSRSLGHNREDVMVASYLR